MTKIKIINKPLATMESLCEIAAKTSKQAGTFCPSLFALYIGSLSAGMGT
ncbi:hypothetical protein [Streptococcus pantholopis]|nr:hypothetical protein [Streptococcus pantholopis]